MENTRDSFIFYRSFYEAIKDLPIDEKAKVFDAICELSLNFEEVELMGISKSLFILIKPQIEANRGFNVPEHKRFHWNWKGGISDENNIIRTSSRMKQWRKLVFERDKYTCQDCGQKGGNLNAHHIKPFSVFTSLRFELSNGLTMCMGCHINLHKTEREWQ